MNKSQLIEAIAEKSEMTKKHAEVFINAFTEVIAQAMKEEDKVQLIGFGTFEVKHTAQRTGRNPKTGEAITIAAAKHPAFSASKTLKESIQ